MTNRDPQAYGPPIAELLADDRVMPLGPGSPNQAVHAKLTKLSADNVLGEVAPTDRKMAALLVSALWLYHDFLDESHTISQSVETTSGSFLHGIMHRREGDYGNSKYWFRRVMNHPTFPAIAGAAADVGFPSNGPHASWDPFGFIDQVERVIGRGTDEERVCRQVQMLEWWILFDFLFRSAGGNKC